jgi:hypothetical protein
MKMKEYDKNNEPDFKVDIEAGYETHDARLKPIIIIGVVSIILLVFSLYLVNALFVATKERLVQEMVLAPQSVTMRELRARENEILNSYRVIDAERGIYQIPVDRAMELIANEAYEKR